MKDNSSGGAEQDAANHNTGTKLAMSGRKMVLAHVFLVLVNGVHASKGQKVASHGDHPVELQANK